MSYNFKRHILSEGERFLKAVTYSAIVLLSRKECKIGRLLLKTTSRKLYMAHGIEPCFPTFRPMSVLAKRLDESGYHLVYGGRPQPGDITLDGDPAPQRKGAQQPRPTLRPISIVFKRSHISTTAELLFFLVFFIMAALRSRCGHYIFALWFLPSFFISSFFLA